MPRFIIAATCAALALSLGACGDDDSTDASSTPAPAADTTPAAAKSGASISVGMKDIKFVPASVTAKVGQKIVWTNNEPIVHNVTATKGADFESDSLNEGDTFEYTTQTAGTIDYVCTIHSGQDGTLIVRK